MNVIFRTYIGLNFNFKMKGEHPDRPMSYHISYLSAFGAS